MLGEWYSKVAHDAAFANATPAAMRKGGWPDSGYHDAGIEFALRKTRNKPFVIPVDTGTSNDVDMKFMRSRGLCAAVLPGKSAMSAPKTLWKKFFGK